jgi:hypothetical protein
MWINVHLCVCMYTYMYVCYIYVCMCKYVYMYIYMHVCLYVYLCLCICISNLGYSTMVFKTSMKLRILSSCFFTANSWGLILVWCQMIDLSCCFVSLFTLQLLIKFKFLNLQIKFSYLNVYFLKCGWCLRRS